MCVALESDLLIAGFLYLEIRDDDLEPPRHFFKLLDLAESLSPLVRDIVGKPCDIVGQSPEIRAVQKFVREQAGQDAPVLIEGPVGMGKRLAAEAIHRQSARQARPFLWDFCSPSPSGNTALERLYGFGPATWQNRIERANGGTLLLKDIEDLDLATQAELLRFMREGTFKRVSDTVVRRTNLRVIITTQKKLEDLVSDGVILEELYWQFAANRIAVPSLSEISEDIPLLASYFLRTAPTRQRVKRISPDALDLLKRGRWTHNVVQLQQAVLVSAMRAKGDIIDGDNLLQHFKRSSRRR